MPNRQNEHLRIGTVSASRGRIGMTLCPGKKQTEAASGDHNRDLQDDLCQIVHWGASSLVSVIEESELRHLHVPDLGEKAESLGLDWYHLPVADVQVPDADFESLWVYAGHRLRRALSKGDGVLIHCKGGLGRTGTVAARLLVELGDSPDAAIAKVRQARTGAIETADQERYVRRCARITSDDQYTDRVLGCLLGGAVGDALGYEVEFDSWETIQRKFGSRGIRDIKIHDGVARVSDDTQITMFTLEGVLRALSNSQVEAIAEIRRGYLDWLSTQGGAAHGWIAAGTLCNDDRLRHRRAPGNTCLAALRSGSPVSGSKGCGGVMRVAPIGLVQRWSPAQAFRIGARAAELTHGHPTGYLAAGALASIIRDLVDGRDPAKAAARTLSILKSEDLGEETAESILAALKTDQKRTALPVVAHLGEGWIAEEALSIGLHSALVGSSFSDALRVSANHDGDSDSTASISGQIRGAWQGLSDLPNPWVRKIDVLVPILRLAGELIKAEGKHLAK